MQTGSHNVVLYQRPVCHFNNLNNKDLSVPLRLKYLLLMEVWLSPPNLAHHKGKVKLKVLFTYDAFICVHSFDLSSHFICARQFSI